MKSGAGGRKSELLLVCGIYAGGDESCLARHWLRTCALLEQLYLPAVRFKPWPWHSRKCEQLHGRPRGAAWEQVLRAAIRQCWAVASDHIELIVFLGGIVGIEHPTNIVACQRRVCACACACVCPVQWRHARLHM